MLALCLSTTIYAQPGLDDDGVSDAPLDGGISLLASAGLAFGIKKLYDQKSGKSKDKPEVE